MASTQTLSLGRGAEPVAAAMARLAAQRTLPRLWERDAGLWTADPAAQAHIRDRLGWLTHPRVMARQTQTVRAFADDVRRAGFTHALLLGMGGSGLFSEVCRCTFGSASGALDLTVLDTTDPAAIRAAQARCPLRELFIIVSSKSGSTSEIIASSKYFYEMLKSAGDAGAHCAAITDAGTPLEAQAEALGFRRAFVHGPGNGQDVGGRFSALTYFGLVPAALLGVDIDRLLSRAMEMLDRCGPSVPAEENPAAQLGAVLGALAESGRDKVSLLCAPALESFGTWVEQLVAESTGKSGKGIAPFFGEALLAPSAYPPDRLFVELQLASHRDAAVDRQVQGLLAAGHPVVRIHWQDRHDLGGEVIRWAMATAVAGALLGLDPFDEPNVQESKDRTKALLAQYARDRAFPAEPPLASADGITAYGRLSGRPQTPAQCLEAWASTGRRGDYLALLSFLPRTHALDQAVGELRHQLARRLGRAVMLGIGPRYLHSTGQLYKGGPDNALFLQLTADDAEDLAIPGEPYTFGALKHAQALGDYQAMAQQGRRLLRLHLGADAAGGLRWIAQALGAAARA
jgi:glucose-6-phosphate isomerase